MSGSSSVPILDLDIDVDSYPGTIVHEPYRPHPKIMDILAETLKNHGHDCVGIVGSKNHTFKWCEKDICPDAIMRDRMRLEQKKQMDFQNELIEKGHTCIMILESYPVQISWCKNDVCTGPNE